MWLTAISSFTTHVKQVFVVQGKDYILTVFYSSTGHFSPIFPTLFLFA